MFNQLLSSREVAALQTSAGAVAAPEKERKAGRGVLALFHHSLSALGISALCILAVMFVKPDFADQIMALSPFSAKLSAQQHVEMVRLAALVEAPAKPSEKPAEKQPATGAGKQLLGNETQQRWVTNWLAKRYRVAKEAANMLVSAAYVTAHEVKIDPLLILAVMAVESRFNPFAESPVGAQGLMQVMSKVHKDKFEDHGGVKAALNPVANIKVGAQILKDYVERGGSIEAGLKGYVGAAMHDSDYGYGAKVMAEYHRLKEVASGKKVPVTTTAGASRKQRVGTQRGELQVKAPEVDKSGAPDKLATADEWSVQL